MYYVTRNRQISAESPDAAPVLAAPPPGTVVVFRNALADNEKKHFCEVYGHAALLHRELLRITRPAHRPAKPLQPFVAVHVRMGDFAAPSLVGGIRPGVHNVRLPVEWYAQMLVAVRQGLGADVPALVFREFPLVAVPGGLINAAGGTMTALLMYGAFDAAVSGQYGLVERSLMLPVGMVAVAVSQVFIADLSASLRDGGGNALRLYRGVVRRMFMLGLLPAVLVGLFAPAVFAIAFGPTWTLAGEMARIMAPLVLVALVTSSVNMAIMILGWQKVQLGWELARLVAVSAAWLSIVKLDLPPTVAIGLHVAVSVLMSLAFLWLADHMLRRHASQFPMAPCGRAILNP